MLPSGTQVFFLLAYIHRGSSPCSTIQWNQYLDSAEWLSAKPFLPQTTKATISFMQCELPHTRVRAHAGAYTRKPTTLTCTHAHNDWHTHNSVDQVLIPYRNVQSPFGPAPEFWFPSTGPWQPQAPEDSQYYPAQRLQQQYHWLSTAAGLTTLCSTSRYQPALPITYDGNIWGDKYSPSHPPPPFTNSVCALSRTHWWRITVSYNMHSIIITSFSASTASTSLSVWLYA